MTTKIQTGPVQTILLDWYDRNRRNLPWRLKKPNPYKTWISEMMLQQTRVDAVLPYFQSFLRTFPTIQSLARATVDEVLNLWSGLGYYSRARNLHKAAQLVVKKHKGELPNTQEDLKKLPGIGEYSSAAIASIAFGEPVPVLDGNVHRVLTRLFALRGDPKKKPLKDELQGKAQSILSKNRPGDFNQAMMELGALLCTPKDPQCLFCPLRSFCQAHQMGKVHAFPTPLAKPEMQKVFRKAWLIERNGKFLIAKRNGKRHLQSMWEFPQEDPVGLKLKKKKSLPLVRHSIMNQNIFLTPHWVQYRSGKLKKNERYVDYKWIQPSELDQYPSSSINRKIKDLLK